MGSGVGKHKNEWDKKKYKTGKWIFKNVAIGKHAPQGQAITVVWTESIGGRKSQQIDFGQTFTVQPKGDLIAMVFRPTAVKDMKQATVDIHDGLQFDDTRLYVSESQNKNGLIVVGRHMLSPQAAHYA